MSAVAIVGGCGRIGQQVARDLVAHASIDVVVTGRAEPPSLGPHQIFARLDLNDRATLHRAIAECDLVVHCAGPFHDRDGRVLEACIERGIHYLDVSDHRSFARRVLPWHERAVAAGVTAILHTGVFPGISNCIARQGVEQFERVEEIRLDYAVAGSGGAGPTVMRTTFLGLQRAFDAWLDGRWQSVLPFSDRETVRFPPPFGRVGVYWFDVAETESLAQTFTVDRVITKFGSVPDLYNRLTWAVARLVPSRWLEHPAAVEFLARTSKQMTDFSDRFSGIGIAMGVTVTGIRDGHPARYRATFTHDNTAVAAGCGTGSLAEAVLDGRLRKPGIWTPEAAVPTKLFQALMTQRDLAIASEIAPLN
ncbi:Saccharopine dehydrogenase [Rubidibacter lacunae KORDI 51-2]|uniref:Saccharopine dehydrogenase n=1 Tax=Rubidibacter lacunae KORDI 51-2 TaxID=582515 RepID=U5DFV1_9CHRO|nr:saccharopine dehydrogenase NADP-binding domain-containing protein [Rubidibacter lacunae]ERN40127.1 Saccharopine dehydrogenase [Rubidibacter lacunae KORDI 51-2]